MVALGHSKCAKVYSFAVLWLSQDMACVQTDESKPFVWQCWNVVAGCVNRVRNPPNGSTGTQSMRKHVLRPSGGGMHGT